MDAGSEESSAKRAHAPPGTSKRRVERMAVGAALPPEEEPLPAPESTGMTVAIRSPGTPTGASESSSSAMSAPAGDQIGPDGRSSADGPVRNSPTERTPCAETTGL